MTIPIFIITRDRVSCLVRSMKSYRPLGDVEIVIHDNGSTYPKMVTYLEELEQNGVKVYKHQEQEEAFGKISESVEKTIRRYFDETKNPSKYFVVTDPDIVLENPSPKTLQVYITLLENARMTNGSVPLCVGPMLRIDDIPDHFKFKEYMQKVHYEQFWKYPRSKALVGGEPVEYQIAWIDTTFAVYKTASPYTRLNKGLRVHEPHLARHLDWYIDTENLTEEQQYYIDHCDKKVSSVSRHITEGVEQEEV